MLQTHLSMTVELLGYGTNKHATPNTHTGMRHTHHATMTMCAFECFNGIQNKSYMRTRNTPKLHTSKVFWLKHLCLLGECFVMFTW